MSSIFNMPWSQVFDGSGNTLSGAKLYFYIAGTSTLQNVYADGELSVPLTNPVIANSGGRFQPIYVMDTLYKVALYTASDELIWTADNLDFTKEASDTVFADSAINQTISSAGLTEGSANNLPLAIFKYADAPKYYNEVGSTDNLYVLEKIGNYATGTGTMDYYIGQQAIFISTRPNTVAGLVQIDVDGKGSKFIKRFDGNNPKYGELSGLLHLVYDGTYFRIINHTQNDVEIGDIKPSVLDTNHNNWLLCNGQAISRNDYSELFNLIGTSFGSGDGETTFNVPDYRGKFLRGLGGNSAADIYTTQVEGLPNIEGSVAATALYNTLGNEIADGAFYFGDAITEQESAGSDEYMQHKICFDASRANNIYGASQHVTPINQAVNWFIKAR